MADTCTATAKGTGKRCQRDPVKGASVCHMHGGAAPQVQQAAARRQAVDMIQEKGAEIDRQYGVGLHPVQHLLHELYVAAGNAAVLGEEVTQWEPSGDEGKPQHVSETSLWRAYSEERDRHARLADVAIRAGIAERQVQLAERQAEEVAAVIRAILTDLGVMDRSETPEILRKHLLRLKPGTNTERVTPRVGTLREGEST